MRYIVATLMLVCLSITSCAKPAAEMKTHSSQAPNAKVTVVHFGAPW